MSGKALVGSVGLLCAVAFLAGCSTGKVDVATIPAPPSDSSMTVEELLEEPFVQGMDTVFKDTITNDDVTVIVKMISADSTLNEYSVVKQSDRYLLDTRFVQTTNMSRLAEGELTCERSTPEGTVRSREEEREAKWTCSNPGYDFYSPEFDKASMLSPVEVLKSEMKSETPLEVEFSTDPVSMTIAFTDSSGAVVSTVTWGVESDKISVLLENLGGARSEVEIRPSVTEDVPYASMVNKVMAPSLPPAPSSSNPLPVPSASPSTSLSGFNGTPRMRTLCERMVTKKLLVEDAILLAEKRGFTARVVNVDGEEQPVTADYREDRFNFVSVDGRVVSCTYG